MMTHFAVGRPGTLYKTPNPFKTVKQYYFDGFRRVPGEASKNSKSIQYRRFRRIPGKSSTNRPREANNHQKCQMIVFGTPYLLYVDKHIVAASGRSQKRCGGLRPPPLFWTLCCQNIVKRCPTNNNLKCLTMFSFPRTMFRGFSECPPK